MPVYRLSQLPVGNIGSAYSTAQGPVVLGQHLEFAQVHYQSGKGARPHRHPHEQLIYVVEGQLWARVGEEEFVAEPGDIIHVPPDVEHEVMAKGGPVTAISCKNLVNGQGSPR
ncbi:cupin domain-containing protein [Thermaerobacter composti]|uniref:cupin domain-containing protein n=1 Tax=Thermaerobacter composti TaxID=554949 RepID=UPI0039A1F77F